MAKPLLRKTRKAWNESGHAHFLTFSCFKRWPLLNSDRSRHWVIAALARARQDLRLDLYAYVIMPEHVHVLLRPLDPHYEMRRILVGLKRPVSDASREYLVESGQTTWLDHLTVQYPSRSVFRFWQAGGGFDQNIFKERTVESVIDYIHANPVRRGLVDVPTDWPWASARFWSGDTSVPIRMDYPA